MKKILGISVLSLLTLAIINKLKNKKAALENFEVGGIDLAIDTPKSRAAFFTKLFYTLRVEIINNENAGINLTGLNLEIFFRGVKIASLIKTSNIVIPANTQKLISLDSMILSINVITAIVEFLADQKDIVFNVKGHLNTSVGKIPIDKNLEVKA